MILPTGRYFFAEAVLEIILTKLKLKKVFLHHEDIKTPTHRALAMSSNKDGSPPRSPVKNIFSRNSQGNRTGQRNGPNKLASSPTGRRRKTSLRLNGIGHLKDRLLKSPYKPRTGQGRNKQQRGRNVLNVSKYLNLLKHSI